MTLRTARLLGRAYSDADPVNLQIRWNGFDVWNGSVPTRPISDKVFPPTPGDVLCEWTFAMDVYGSIPIWIHVTNGELSWQSVYTNYSALSQRYELKVDAVWPQLVPASTEEAYQDFEFLSPEEFAAKYGAGAAANFELKTISPPEENFGPALPPYSESPEPNLDDDGKNNVRIDGVIQQIDLGLRQQGLRGDWVWRTGPGQVIEADITVGPPELSDLG